MLAAIIAGAVALAAAVTYVVSLKGDIAVANTEVKALQKSQDAWIGEFREQIRKLERVIEVHFMKQPSPAETTEKPRSTAPTGGGRR